jgi:2-C-methyl-D-erythritol 4-phosphate cytidylyltransferase
MSTWAIVVAAGSGTRYGGAKQLVELAGTPVYERSLAAASATCDGVVLVVAEDHRSAVATAIDAAAGPGRVDPVLVVGGPTRSESVRRGLAAVPSDADVIVVHDAARPLASPALFEKVVAEIRRGADAAVPGLPVVDTIRHLEAGVVDRERLVAVQTPQAFRAAALRKAHEGAPDASDDASLVEAVGGIVVIVPGEPANRKITTPVDLVIAEALLRDPTR